MSTNKPDATRWSEGQICRSTKFIDHHQIWIDDWKIGLGTWPSCNRPVFEHLTHSMGMSIKHDAQGIEIIGGLFYDGPTVDLRPARMRKILKQLVPLYAAIWVMTDDDVTLLLKHMLRTADNQPLLRSERGGSDERE